MVNRKISVIVPMYNVEFYIRECLESVLSQTLQDFEIICINDGSEDNTAGIVEEYRSRDNRILMFYQENKGLSAARNRGMTEATGKYILFLDSDDYLKINALERLYQKAEAEDLDELFYSAAVFYDNCPPRQEGKYDHYYERKGDYSVPQNGKELFIKMNQKRELKPSACLQLFRRDFLYENSLTFYEGIIHEDNLFTMQCLTFAKRAAFLNEELYMRRVREDSIMTKERGFKNAYGYYVTIRELICFAEKNHLSKDAEYFQEYQRRLCLLSDVAASYVPDFKNDLQECLESLNETDQILFQLLVVNGNTVRERIRRMEQTKAREEVEALKQSKTYAVGEKITALHKKWRGLFS